MSLPLPNLDDRTYADLVEEAISSIPFDYPEWTDRNPSDTGIILIELLAWLTEMVLYRVNQIPDQNLAVFLSLLKGQEWELQTEPTNTEPQLLLRSEVQKTLQQLRQVYRAVTPEDFEHIIWHDWPNSNEAKELGLGENTIILRVKCLAELNLELQVESKSAEGHISIILISKQDNQQELEKLKNNLKIFLDKRRLLTTCLHILSPKYKEIKLAAKVYLKNKASPKEVKEKIEKEIKYFFAPVNSVQYWNGKGWPFGRSVCIADLYVLLNNIPGVDYVEDLKLNNNEQEIKLESYELVNNQTNMDGIEIWQKLGVTSIWQKTIV